MDDSAVVTNTFQRDKVAFGHVGGVERHAGLAVGISLDLRIPIKSGAAVGTRTARFGQGAIYG